MIYLEMIVKYFKNIVLWYDKFKFICPYPGIREKTVSNKDGKYILKELLFKSGYMYFINNFFILYLKAVCYLYLPISIMDRIITLKRNNYLMRKLNILFVFHVPFIAQNGGVERVTDILSRHLINRGYSVFI